MVKTSKLINFDVPLVLASKSPRRIKLLKNLGFDFEVMPSDVDENIPEDLQPADYVCRLSLLKARDIAEKQITPAIILGADTTVYLNGEYLNKPKDKNNAYEILKKLSGNTHQVFTGITLINTKTNKELTDFQVTNVRFRELRDDEIWAYIESGSPMDKAGAYGIQDDFGAVFVDHIEGCYYNIVGLPLELTYRRLFEITQSD